MFWARMAADAVVFFHMCYVLFVVIGLMAILAGIARGWAWVRNPWFRLAHLAAIGYVVLEAFIGWDCPLTVWENALRKLGGQRAYQVDFLGYWSHRLIYFDLPPAVFTAGHVLFGVSVFLTFLLAPPRRPAFASPRSHRGLGGSGLRAGAPQGAMRERPLQDSPSPKPRETTP